MRGDINVAGVKFIEAKKTNADPVEAVANNAEVPLPFNGGSTSKENRYRRVLLCSIKSVTFISSFQ